MWVDEGDDIDDGNSMKVETLEAGLFEQRVQMRRWSATASLSLGRDEARGQSL